MHATWRISLVTKGIRGELVENVSVGWGKRKDWRFRMFTVIKATTIPVLLSPVPLSTDRVIICQRRRALYTTVKN
jgi:hypothetical protein